MDAGPDAAFDSGVDSSFDDAQDGSHPSDASDAGFDGGFDTGADIGDDAGQDAGADAGLDGGGDAGTGPVITSIDGDGTTSAVVDEGGVVTGLPGRLDATHRFQKKWVVTGDRLDTVTDAKLEKSGGGVVFTAADGLVFESGGTAMQRNLLLPAALVTGAFALTLGNGAGDATAQVYVLQGEKGDQGIGLKGDKGDTGTQGPAGVSVAAASEAPGANCTYGGVKYTSTSGDTYVCNGAPGSQGTKGDTGSQGTAGISVTAVVEPAGANCTYGGVKYTSASGTNYVCKGDKGDQGIQGIQGTQGIQGPAGTFSGTFTGDVTFTGNATISGSLSVSSLSVSSSYSLPDCPSGYTRDATCAPWAGGCQGVILCKRGSDEMVKVGDFWIDRYESAVVNATQYAGGNCSGAGTPYGQSAYDYDANFPRTGNFSTPAYACSLKSVKPSAYMTWFQAQEACALAGKQLCSNEEWQAAAAGTYDTTGTETGTQCHIATGNTSARNTGLAGATPGGTDSCISKWGTEDMVGNLWEWVSMWGQGGPDSGVVAGGYAGNVTSNNGFAGFSPETSGDGDGTWNLAGTAYGCNSTGASCGWKVGLPFAAFRGGSWNTGPQAGVFALYLSYGPSYTYYTLGARCCRQR